MRLSKQHLYHTDLRGLRLDLVRDRVERALMTETEEVVYTEAWGDPKEESPRGNDLRVLQGYNSRP